MSVVVLMVVWIAEWVCMQVLFHVLFHTRPPMVASDVYYCAFYSNYHKARSYVVDPTCIHFAPCQSPTPPFCMLPTPVHHASSTAVLPSSQRRLIHLHDSCDHTVCVCTVVMKCITCLYQSSTRCVCATLVPSSVVITFALVF